MAQPIENLRKIRLQKLAQIKKLGITPYPARCRRTQIVAQALKMMGKKVAVAGRIMAIRGHGGIQFFDLRDESGKIQLVFKKEKLSRSDKLRLLVLLDVGDFIDAAGEVFKTQAGEISVLVSDFHLLTKSIRPLPSIWYGLKDEESRYRQRYLDLLLSQDVKSLFHKKAAFWQSMRDFLVSKGFLEVETPVLESTAGGADATPFVTHHNALDIDLYLRISMGELWQKRLMVAGFEKTFEIGRQFRNEGIDREHLQDYTQMEFYWAYASYEEGMKLVEEMFKEVAHKTFGTFEFEMFGHKVNLGKKWGRLDYVEEIKKQTGVDVLTATAGEIKKKLKELQIPFGEDEERARLIDQLWKKIRREIAGPTFVVGQPVAISPLAKRREDKPEVTERYFVLIAGSELGNGYSELNDPVDQAERFQTQQKMRDQGDEEAQMNDQDFVMALEYGMPPVTGFGVSERLFSFLANKPIRETVLFPLLRPENIK